MITWNAMSIALFERCRPVELSTKSEHANVPWADVTPVGHRIRSAGGGGMDWVRIVAGVLLALGGLGIAWYAPRAVKAWAMMASTRRERQHLLHRLDRLDADRRCE